MTTGNKMSAEELAAFRASLSTSEQQTFDQMSGAWQQSNKDLGCHLTIGRCVLELQGGDDRTRPYGRISQLARALGCVTSVLDKHREFAKTFTVWDVQQLSRDGIKWAMVIYSRWIKNKQKRMKWMKRAQRENWTIARLKMENRKASKGGRRAGGRKRVKLKSYGPIIDLQHLVGLTEEWLRHFREVWAATPSGLINQLATLSVQDYSRQLLNEIKKAEQLLAELAKTASKIREPLLPWIEKIHTSLDSNLPD